MSHTVATTLGKLLECFVFQLKPNINWVIFFFQLSLMPVNILLPRKLNFKVAAAIAQQHGRIIWDGIKHPSTRVSDIVHVTSVTVLPQHQIILKRTKRQSTRLWAIFVTCLTMLQQEQTILRSTKSPNMRVSDTHVTSVIMKQQQHVILKSKKKSSMRVSDTHVASVIMLPQQQAL